MFEQHIITRIINIKKNITPCKVKKNGKLEPYTFSEWLQSEPGSLYHADIKEFDNNLKKIAEIKIHIYEKAYKDIDTDYGYNMCIFFEDNPEIEEYIVANINKVEAAAEKFNNLKSEIEKDKNLAKEFRVYGSPWRYSI